MTDILSVSGEDEGVLTFYASTFGGEPDLVGDIINPRAFDKWYEAFKARPDAVLPIVWSHSWGDAFALIGYAKAEDISIDSHGLKVRAHLDITHNPTAAQVFRQAKAGIVTEASFSYDVKKEHRRSDGSNVLDELTVIEAGPCLKGANPLAGVVDAKRLVGAKSMVDTVYKAKLERLVSQANSVGRPIPQAIADECRKWGVPLSAKEFDASRPRCRKGHLVPMYEQVEGIARATYCAVCDQWQIMVPKSMSDAAAGRILSKLKSLTADVKRDEGVARFRREAVQAEARKRMREMGVDPYEPSDEELHRQFKEIEFAVAEKKNSVESDLQRVERILLRRAEGW